jgi:thioredoxin 1
MQTVTTLSAFTSILKGNKHVFVDFYADWCGPCRMIAPIVDNLSKANSHIAFVKVNVDDAQELAREYGVSAMPTFLAFTNGTKVAEIVGADKAKIESTVASMK